MAQIDTLPPLRDVIAAHGLNAKKSLGQNFLLDLNLTSRIARSAGRLDDCTVLEVGPGPGGLTRALLAAGAKKVVAIEKDSRCLPALEEIAAHYPGRLEVVEGDALKQDPVALTGGDKVRIAANLPYNVGTQLLLVNWITTPQWPPFWQSLTLMFQKEVAERIAAQPGSKAYGRPWRPGRVALQGRHLVRYQPKGVHTAAQGDQRSRSSDAQQLSTCL